MIIVFNNKTILNEEMKIIVNEIQSSCFSLFKIKVTIKYLNKIRNIDVIARLFPITIS